MNVDQLASGSGVLVQYLSPPPSVVSGAIVTEHGVEPPIELGNCALLAETYG
jgi:hypothetical protein